MGNIISIRFDIVFYLYRIQILKEGPEFQVSAPQYLTPDIKNIAWDMDEVEGQGGAISLFFIHVSSACSVHEG